MSEPIILNSQESIEIYNTINSLDIHKASGLDNISFFLRIGNKILTPNLSVFFTMYLCSNIFPKFFKTAEVIPVFKSRNKQLIKNYRHISLLPCLSKVLEKLIKSCLIKFFDKNHVLYDHQYGFRENHRVTHAVLDVITQEHIQGGCWQPPLRRQ